MKNTAVIFLLILFSLSAVAQKPKTTKNISKTALVKSVPGESSDDKAEFNKALAQTDVSERVTALQKFVAGFPESEERIHAQELIVSGRAQIADEKLRSNDVEGGIEIFKLAVKAIPTPVSDKLFTEIVLQIPTNIFFRGQRGAAVDVARLIEEKIEGNAKQLLGLATFYIGTENAAQAQRLANKAIEIEPDFPAAYQTLGLANRLNFQLEDAADAYAKALQLDNQSIVSKRSLAEMKRAVGKSSEAVELYREILATDAADKAAETGLILALFDADKKTEAETEMTRSLEINPNNLFLLVGASYWYAAHGNGAKAVELGQRAVQAEPRYTWAHIALARGLSVQNRPLEAERTLIAARQFGNFPTLDYELASVRMAAGFYREAANGLKKTFSVKNGEVQTKLGGRVPNKAENFIGLLAAERRASIFEPAAADNLENAERLKSLLVFSQQLDSSNPGEETIAAAADSFAAGGDEMKIHRRIYAAQRLLEKGTAVTKALELTKAAVGGVDSALNSPNAAAAVLAEELYDSRVLAISRNEIIIVPEVPRATLSNILRGKIEELTGWALFQQDNSNEAATHFKRALSVLPEKSSWWRDSMWRLGLALQGENKPEEALEAYFKSYTSSAPEISKRIIIEVLYQKINGSLEGLDEKIGIRPDSTIADLPVRGEAVAQATDIPPMEEPIAAEPEPNIPRLSQTPAEEEVTLPKVSQTPLLEKKSLSGQNAATERKAVENSETTAKITPTPVPKLTMSEPAPTPEVLPIEEVKVPETSPEPQVADVTVAKAGESPTPKVAIEPTPLPVNSPTPEIQAIEPKSLPTPKIKVETENAKPAENQVAEAKNIQSQNSPFDPIIITVPKTEIIRKKTDPVSTVENKPKNALPDEMTPENSTPKDPETRLFIKDNLSKTRVRVVGEAKAETVQPCKIVTSQENVSILNDGGSLGILVGFEDGGNVKKIKSASSSPDDIDITFEPEIGALSGRAFFIIKSISPNKGTFTGIFEAPCGRKEISVKVR